jgi:hypothetical protein
MTYATYDDLKQVEANIAEYGVLDWDIELDRSASEIQRVLKVRWWNTFVREHPSLLNTLPNYDLLDPSQFTQATVYHSLAYHICPKLTQFSGAEPDKFQVMMEYYRGRFEHEMDLILREGVRYDINNDSTIDLKEQTATKTLRLVR